MTRDVIAVALASILTGCTSSEEQFPPPPDDVADANVESSVTDTAPPDSAAPVDSAEPPADSGDADSDAIDSADDTSPADTAIDSGVAADTADTSISDAVVDTGSVADSSDSTVVEEIGVDSGADSTVTDVAVDTTADAETSAPCPTHSGTDFYANPVVRPAGSPTPTGVRSPAYCAFPTIGEALSAASAKVTGGASSARVLLDGATTSAPATFASETSPLSIPTSVTVTTTDDPAAGGAGLDPTRYVVVWSGSGTSAVQMSGGTLRGVTLQNGAATTGSVLACTSNATQIERVAIDAQSSGGARVPTGVSVGSTCTLTMTNVSVRRAALDGLVVAGTATVNGGSIATSGRDGIVATGTLDVSDTTIEQNGGTGVVVRGSGETALNNIVVRQNVGVGLSVGDLGGTSTAKLRVFGSSSLVTLNQSGGVLATAHGGLIVWGAKIADNLAEGVQSFGAMSLVGVEISGNGDDGVVVDSNLTNAMSNCAVHANTGDGIRLLRTDTTSGAVITGPDTKIYENSGAGVRMGLTSIVKVTLGDAAIYKNNVGVVVQQSGPATTPTTFATIRANLIYENTGPGVILSGGTLSPMRGGFESNRVFNNGLPTAGVCSGQTAPQIEVAGRIAVTTTDAASCTSKTSATDCAAVTTVSCLWTGVACTPAWSLAGTCGSTENQIYSYEGGTTPVTLGLYAKNDSVVDVDNARWRFTMTSRNIGQDSTSFVRSDLICATNPTCM